MPQNGTPMDKRRFGRTNHQSTIIIYGTALHALEDRASPKPGETLAVLGAGLGFLWFNAPPAAIFYFRVCAGVWGFLQRSRIRGNWYRVGQDFARRRGLRAGFRVSRRATAR